jgi:hypothetical protein
MLDAQVTGQVAVGAGSATDARGVHASAATIAPSVTFSPDADASLSLLGNATFFQQGAWSLGGGGAFASRATMGGGLALTFNAGANAMRTSYAATLATGSVTPALEWSWRALTLFGGASAAGGYTAVNQQRVAVPVPGSTTLASVSRTGYGPIYGGRLDIQGDDPSVAMQLGVRAQPMRVNGEIITDRTADATLLLYGATVSASAGMRQAADEHVRFASAALTLPLHDGVALEAAAGAYPSNRLTGAAGGNFVSLGLSLRLGGSHAERLPVPAGVPLVPKGMTRLSIDAPDASRVEVAGDWNDWQPVSATRADNGVWYADLQLPAGEYRYAFRVDGREWRVPRGAAAVDDGFGGKSAYVTVRDAGTTQVHNTQEEK